MKCILKKYFYSKVCSSEWFKSFIALKGDEICDKFFNIVEGDEICDENISSL